MSTKIILTGINLDVLKDIQENLLKYYEGFSEIKYFSTEDDSEEYLDKNTLRLSYKNNALLLVNKDDDDNYSGISYDSFENNNLLCIPINELNEISDNILAKYDVLIVWYDTKHHKNISTKMLKYYINETNYLMDKLSKINNIYFLDEEINIVSDVINEYINANETHRSEIIKDFS